MGCTVYVAKTKALISFPVTPKLICVFVFRYAKSRFSHVAAKLCVTDPNLNMKKNFDQLCVTKKKSHET